MKKLSLLLTAILLINLCVTYICAGSIAGEAGSEGAARIINFVPPVPAAADESDREAVKVTVDLGGNGSALLTVGAYNEKNKLLALKSETVTESGFYMLSLKYPAGTAKVKAMLWNGAAGMVPLCASVGKGTESASYRLTNIKVNGTEIIENAFFDSYGETPYSQSISADDEFISVEAVFGNADQAAEYFYGDGTRIFDNSSIPLNDKTTVVKILVTSANGVRNPEQYTVSFVKPSELPEDGFKGLQFDGDGHLVATAHKYGMVPTFEDGKAPKPNRTVYVSNDGSDDKGDGSLEKPFETIDKAIKFFGTDYAGGAIKILPGTYHGGMYREYVYATEEEPFWIGGTDPDNRPVLDGAGLMIVKGAYVIMHDMEIRNVKNGRPDDTSTAIHVHENQSTMDAPHVIDVYDGNGVLTHQADTHHFVFRNLHVTDIGYQNFKFAGTAYTWIYDCEISYDIRGASCGIDYVGGHYTTIAYNYIHHIKGVGVQIKGGSYEADIYGNLFVKAGGYTFASNESFAPTINMGQATGREFFRPPLLGGTDLVGNPIENRNIYEAKGIRAYSNIIVDSVRVFAMYSASDCAFVNNTVINPDRSILVIANSDPNDLFTLGNHGRTHSGTIANNIYYLEKMVIIENSEENDNETFTVDKNLIYHPAYPGSFPASDVQVGPDGFNPDNTYSTDPMFVDMPNCNFRLKPMSQAIAAGSTDPGLPDIKTDYEGKPFAYPRSVGAIQY